MQNGSLTEPQLKKDEQTMLLSELLENIPHDILQGDDTDISTIQIDSRKVQYGALFICLIGLSFDGHEYALQAVESGATAVLVEKGATYLAPSTATVVQVENTRLAMSLVAANFFANPAKKLRLIGVTGTNGKTTTTVFLDEILRNCGQKTGLIGTVGAKLNGKPLDFSFATSTTPDPLELHEVFSIFVSHGVTDVVMEVTSHALHFHKMAGLWFDVGVFTNLSQDHLDIHGTMENYMLAKAKLFSQSKKAVINIDDEAHAAMVQHLEGRPYVSYAINNDADLLAEEISFGKVTQFTIKGIDGTFSLAPKGKFNVYNALAAIGTARTLGIPMDKIKNAVAKLGGVDGRIQEVKNSKGLSVFVDYAHTPDGLINIISAVREFTVGRVITVVGCGGDRDNLKRPIMGRIAGEMSDFTILTSDNPRTENPFYILAQIEVGIKETGKEYVSIVNRKDAIFAGVRMLKDGDSLIIAGKGHEDYQIIGTETIHFSDYEVALEAIENAAND